MWGNPKQIAMHPLAWRTCGPFTRWHLLEERKFVYRYLDQYTGKRSRLCKLRGASGDKTREIEAHNDTGLVPPRALDEHCACRKIICTNGLAAVQNMLAIPSRTHIHLALCRFEYPVRKDHPYPSCATFLWFCWQPALMRHKCLPDRSSMMAHNAPLYMAFILRRLTIAKHNQAATILQGKAMYDANLADRNKLELTNERLSKLQKGTSNV